MATTLLSQTPENKNFLSPLNFNFKLKRAPNLDFFLQGIKMPSIMLPSYTQANPFVSIPFSGEHLQYGNLEVEFKVDEDLKNYLEIHDWLRGLGKPESFDEYAAVAAANPGEGLGIHSDVQLFISNSLKVPNYIVTFEDAHPYTLSGMSFETTDTTVNYVTASVGFKFLQYKIEKI